jgi:AcrR family transcriptional regulator
MKQQVRAEETRARILNAAAMCFARSGYEASSVAEICKEAQVTKGAFYYHFSSKQALFLELLNTWLSSLDLRLQRARIGAETIPEGILGMAENARVIFEESNTYLPMFLEFWLHSVRDPAIWQMVIEPYRRYLEYFSAIMQEGVQEGSLRPIDPQLAARGLLSIAIGLILQGLMDPEGADWGSTAQESISLFVDGIKRQ